MLRTAAEDEEEEEEEEEEEADAALFLSFPDEDVSDRLITPT